MNKRVSMQLVVKEDSVYKFIDEGEGEVLLMLHGLFGALSNWNAVVSHFSGSYRVIIPMMPIYEMPIKNADLEGLCSFIEKFVVHKKLDSFSILGNSLGGHLGLIYTLKNSERVKRLVLTGSSGLFENGMGGSYPRRGSYEFVTERVGYTFYDPSIATKELIDDVFEVTNSNMKCLRMISLARSAQRHNMAEDLHKITIPTLLIWGLNDTITPPVVAHEFHKRIPNSRLFFIDKCSHVPMMEHPLVFNQIFEEFLKEN